MEFANRTSPRRVRQRDENREPHILVMVSQLRISGRRDPQLSDEWVPPRREEFDKEGDKERDRVIR